MRKNQSVLHTTKTRHPILIQSYSKLCWVPNGELNHCSGIIYRLDLMVSPSKSQISVCRLSDKVRDKFPSKSRTQIIKVRDTSYVANFHDLRPRQVHDFVMNLSRTMSQTYRHVEIVCVRDFCDLCRRLLPKHHGFMICHRLCPRLFLRGSFAESRRNGIWA